MFKKIILFISIYALIAAVEVPTFAGVDYDYEAEALNTMHILSGDGIDYNLNAKLRRSEAATFIVKVMGKQNFVLQNKEKYASQGFSDVKADDWFAPYVGYCKRQNIISGFPDGSFRPNEHVTEKAFLTMLLSAMEYDSSKDFTWETVLSKAYEVGLSENILHAVSTEDNEAYYRKDVVHHIFLSLDKFMADKEILMIENLINEGVTRKDIAEKYDLYKVDLKQSAIEKTEVKDYHTLLVTLNETVEPLSKEDVNIKGNKNGVFGIESIETSGKTVTIKTQVPMYSGDTYTVRLESVKDQEGFKTTDISAIFQGLKREKVQSDFFKIKDIEIVDASHLLVSFTHPIDKSAESALNYRFGKSNKMVDGSYNNIEVSTLESQENKILVEFYNLEIEAGSEYAFEVRGDLKSTYNAYMNKGQGDSYKFVGENQELEEFEVVDVDVFDSYYLEIEFSRPVDSESAFTKSNYELTNLDTRNTRTPKSVVYKMEDGEVLLDTVLLEFSKMRKDEEYKIEVDGVWDVFSLEDINRYEADVEGEDYEVRPELDDTEVLDRYTLVLTYDTDLDERSHSVNIDIDNRIEVEEVVWFEEEPDRLYVYLNEDTELDDDEKYEIEVGLGVDDYRGVSGEKEIEIVRGTDERKEDIDIESVLEISPGVIMVKFTDFIDMDEADNDNLYEIEYRVGNDKRYNYPDDVQVINGKTVVLEFDAYPSDYEKVLIVLRVDDPSGQFSYTELEYEIEE